MVGVCQLIAMTTLFPLTQLKCKWICEENWEKQHEAGRSKRDRTREHNEEACVHTAKGLFTFHDLSQDGYTAVLFESGGC